MKIASIVVHFIACLGCTTWCRIRACFRHTFLSIPRSATLGRRLGGRAEERFELAFCDFYRRKRESDSLRRDVAGCLGVMSGV